MKTALITGANKGLGFAAARQLARAGVTVLLGARDAAKGTDAAAALRAEGLEVKAMTLDVLDVASVRRAAQVVQEQYGHLDILINNAGILPEATASDRVDGPADLVMFRDTFDTNVLGAVAVTEAFLPLLRAAPAGRIVNVSSTMGSLADQTDPASGYYGLVLPAYQSSKAALNAMTIAWSKALADTAVTVNAVCPGWVQTDLGGADNKAAAPMTPDEGAGIVTAVALGEGEGVAGTGRFVDAAGVVPW
jgi:NAD(P)-dependent dehydrogenase (short-subunit alcohol dehydrogenase family)